MKKVFPFILIGIITIIFFYKTFFLGLLPFPGDLLISEYQPWRSYSFLGYNPGSYPSKKQYADTIRQIYPWRTFVNQELKQGRIPLWNPHNFSGHPLMANLQSQVFYPLTILYFIFSQPIAWTILVMLQPLLATISMFLYLKTLQRSITSSTLCAIAYGFSHYMTVFLEYNTIGHVMLWLPFTLFSIEKISNDHRLRWKMIFVFSLICSGFAGHLQIFGGIVIFVILYSIVLKTRILSTIIFLLVISFGMLAIQFVPTFELIHHSARSNHEYKDFINRLFVQPKQILTFINPDLFGNPATGNYLLHDSYPGKALFFGSMTFFFSIVGILKKKKTPHETFFIVSSLFLLLFITNNPITRILFKFPIPFIAQSSPGNFIFLLTCSLATLAAFGIDGWIRNERIKKPYALYSIGIIIVIAGYVTKTIPQVQSMILFTFASFIILSFLLLLAKISSKKIIVVIIFAWTCFELFYFFHKFNPFVPKELIYPETPLTNFLKNQNTIGRFYGYGNGNIEANFATQLSLYDPNGYDPLYPRHYGKFIQQSYDQNHTMTFDRSNRSDAVIAPGFGKEEFKKNKERRIIIDTVNTEFIIAKKESQFLEEIFPSSSYHIAYADNEFIVYKNPTAYPRAFFKTTFDSARIVLYTPTRIEIEANTPIKQNLFISNTYMPGWKAFINSKETTIMKSIHPFQEIEVPEGNHRIIFVYKPFSFYAGMSISIISLIVFMLYILFNRYRI
ncbi:MAG: YfhO family protein [Patescibacteria group bacterium]|nr:YfhO family protein [Patescibacteria group bacterium]